MVKYYYSLALANLWKSKGMTLSLVIALGLGIGASMTMITIVHSMSWDPLPGLSNSLYHPHIDPLPLSYKAKSASMDPSNAFTWIDASALLRAAKSDAQTALASGHLLAEFDDGHTRPFFVDGQYNTKDMFDMFGLRFLEGRPWSIPDETDRSRVIVISKTLRDKLGQGQATGRTLHIGGSDFRVVGVVDDWNPRPRFYTDLSGDVFSGKDDFFLPLSTAVDLKLKVSNNVFSWLETKADDKLTDASTAWLQVWVRLGSADAKSRYLSFLESYSAEQHRLGRFQKAPSVRLETLFAWLERNGIVPSEVKIQLILALAFLFICLVNVTALLFAKFIRKSGDVAVRRVLGARRRDVMLQLCVEALVVGVLGGALGLVLAEVGLWFIRRQPEDYAQMASMDLSMLGGTILLALLCSLVAAVVPAWRASSMKVVMQVKGMD